MEFPDVVTARLVLHPVDPEEGQRILDRRPAVADVWAADYPFEGDLAGISAYLHATALHGEQRPFGYYRIARRSDGVAVGGIGFKGSPIGGVVEVGYGLAASARGHGYAREALEALMRTAAELGVLTIRADTELDNVASQRTLERAGFRHLRDDAELRYFEATLGGP
jgi:RimJ/RimL family protein N-acetyltransferase